jgi:branched-chain amino acid transport system ATP-binding protein
MLEVKGICVFYDEVQAIRDASLDVREGEIVTMIGANGAGKTTMLKTISGLKRPASGEILFDGAPIHGLMPDAVVGRGVVQVPEGRRIFPNLSVEENLTVGAHLVRDSARIRVTRDRVYALFPRLKERRRQLGETLSGGEQQMLALAHAYVSEPSVVLLDEVSMGLAPKIVDEIFVHIQKIAASGAALLLVEQYLPRALQVADYVCILNRGRVRFVGEPGEIGEEAVLKSYLGDVAS